MEVYLIIAICILASIGLYALMRRNQDKDNNLSHLSSYREGQPTLEDDIVGSVKVVPIEEYEARKNAAASPKTKQTTIEVEDDIVMVYVAAKQNSYFMGYELMQSLMAQGLQAGPMDIVHRYDEDGRVIFSVAAATDTGAIDLTNMGDFVTPGLCLFLYPQKAIRPRHAFNEMVDCARQLAEELEGQVLDQDPKVWSQEYEQTKREALPAYQRDMVGA